MNWTTLYEQNPPPGDEDNEGGIPISAPQLPPPPQEDPPNGS
jgi:hypothetical protein